MPAQSLYILDTVYKSNLIEVQVLFAFLLQHQRVVDRFRRDVGMMQELGCAEEEGQELVVVEAPDAVGARGLEVVSFLDAAHEAQVCGEDDQGQGGERGWGEVAQSIEAEEPEEEVEFVARTVVDALAVAEGVAEIC